MMILNKNEINSVCGGVLPDPNNAAAQGDDGAAIVGAAIVAGALYAIDHLFGHLIRGNETSSKPVHIRTNSTRRRANICDLLHQVPDKTFSSKKFTELAARCVNGGSMPMIMIPI